MPVQTLLQNDSILPPIKSSGELPLAQVVYESILEAILSGTLKSGAILSEVAVAEMLAVSRTPVHEAITKLAEDGLVEREMNRRPVVAPFTPDDLFEIFEMRRLLECPAAGLAARRMDMRQLSPLRSTQDEMASTFGDDDWLARWVSYDDLFHHTVASGCGNSRLHKDIDRYRLLHSAVNRMIPDTETLRSAVDEHEQILAALEAHDADAAINAMDEHIRHWQDYFVRNFARS